jgi:hypothetical protein
LIKFHILFFVCGWPPLPVSINNTCSAVLNIWSTHKNFIATKSSVHTLEPIVDGSLTLSFLLITKNAILHIAFPWCKPLVQQSSLRHARSTQIDFGWTTLRAQHCLLLSYSMTRLSSDAIHRIKIFQ